MAQPIPDLQKFSLHNCKTINFCCLNPSKFAVICYGCTRKHRPTFPIGLFTKAVSLQAVKSTDILPSLSSVTFPLHLVLLAFPSLPPSFLPSLSALPPSQNSPSPAQFFFELSNCHFSSISADIFGLQITDAAVLQSSFLSLCMLPGPSLHPNFSYHQVENAPKFPTFLLILKSVIYFY